MRRLDKKQTVIVVLVVVVMTGFAVFQYIPIVQKKMHLKKEMSKQTEAMTQIRQYAAKLPELRKEKEMLKEEMEDYSIRIPEGKQFAQLWQQIADVMNECELAEQSVKPGAEQTTEELCCIPLSIECMGTLDQMFEFLESLEQFERLMRIEKIDLENSTNFDAKVKMNATANIYYQPDHLNNG